VKFSGWLPSGQNIPGSLDEIATQLGETFHFAYLDDLAVTSDPAEQEDG